MSLLGLPRWLLFGGLLGSLSLLLRLLFVGLLLRRLLLWLLLVTLLGLLLPLR